MNVSNADDVSGFLIGVRVIPDRLLHLVNSSRVEAKISLKVDGVIVPCQIVLDVREWDEQQRTMRGGRC